MYFRSSVETGAFCLPEMCSPLMLISFCIFGSSTTLDRSILPLSIVGYRGIHSGVFPDIPLLFPISHCCFSSHYVPVQNYVRALLPYTCVPQRSVIHDRQQTITGKCQGLSSPDGFVITFYCLFTTKNVGESVYSISS